MFLLEKQVDNLKGKAGYLAMNNMRETSAKPGESIFVCGAGHQGLSMAAHLALNGVKVTLWNRTKKNIEDITITNKIYCGGIVVGTAEIEKASDVMADVISDFVMVTTPSSAHRDVARELAPYAHKGMVIVLNPGRTFGAIEFCKSLQEFGVKELPQIAETQTIVYTCRKSSPNSITIFALKYDVKIAALRYSNIKYVMTRMPDCLKPHFGIVDTVAMTSFSNVGMILHCAPVMMNIGWIETEMVDFKYYYDGISVSIADFLEKIDKERVSVAKACGFEIESVVDWLKRTYKVSGANLYECIRNNISYKEIDAPPTIRCRYILEDVPIEYLGKQLGVNTSNVSNIISLASSVFNKDFREEGRRFSLDELKDNF